MNNTSLSAKVIEEISFLVSAVMLHSVESGQFTCPQYEKSVSFPVRVALEDFKIPELTISFREIDSDILSMVDIQTLKLIGGILVSKLPDESLIVGSDSGITALFVYQILSSLYLKFKLTVVETKLIKTSAEEKKESGYRNSEPHRLLKDAFFSSRLLRSDNWTGDRHWNGGCVRNLISTERDTLEFLVEQSLSDNQYSFILVDGAYNIASFDSYLTLSWQLLKEEGVLMVANLAQDTHPMEKIKSFSKRCDIPFFECDTTRSKALFCVK